MKLKDLLLDLWSVASSGFVFGIWLVVNLLEGILYLLNCNLQAYWPDASWRLRRWLAKNM